MPELKTIQDYKNAGYTVKEDPAEVLEKTFSKGKLYQDMSKSDRLNDSNNKGFLKQYLKDRAIRIRHFLIGRVSEEVNILLRQITWPILWRVHRMSQM